MIIFNKLPDSPDGRSELSQTDKTSNGSPEMSQTYSARHVLNSSLLLRLSGFRLNSPSTCVPTRRSTHMAQMTMLATEAATLVSTRAIRPRSCHNCCTWHCGIDTSLSRVQLCHSRHTLTSRHQFPLAWADCSSPPSFASIGPHLHTTVLFQSSFLGLFQTSNRERLTGIVSQRGHAHLPHQLLPSQPLVLKPVRGCLLELKHV